MMDKKRVYRDFSRRECALIAIEYAETHFGKSEKVFTTQYNISSSTFYSIIHNAISKCMVSDEIAEKIRNKACSNSRAIAGRKGSHRSFRTYRRLFEERESFSFCKTQAIRYAKGFAQSDLPFNAFATENGIQQPLMFKTFMGVIAEKQVSNQVVEILLDKLAQYYTVQFANSELTQNQFCKVHSHISKEMLAEFLTRGITRGLVSDETVWQMRLTALRRHNSDKVNAFFDGLKEKRRQYMDSKTAL